ncbi:hypothetical protein L451_10264, partial [Klebsiella pneumoniae BIDMC 18D]
ALLAELGETRTVISPALPVNGRTVYQGYLFVGEQLLNESGMRHHPVTPMEDAHLGRLIERQGRGKAALIAWPIVARSPPRWRQSTIRRCAMWCSTPSANRICSPRAWRCGR